MQTETCNTEQCPCNTDHCCKLQMNGEVRTSIQITSIDEDVTITVWGSPNCSIRILAVGGGGGE